MIYQAYRLKIQKKALGAKKRSLKIALSISKPTKENVDKTQLSKQRKEHQSNLQEGILFLGPKKQCIRRNQSNLQRKDPIFKTNKRESRQSARKNPVFKTKERASKQYARRNPVFRAKETVYQKESKQSARKDPVFKTKERESRQSAKKNLSLKQKKEHQSNLQEGILFLEPKKLCIRRNQSSFLEKILFSRLKKLCIKRNQSRERGKSRLLKSKKKNARISRKKKARENPYVLECERIKKQQIRQEKRKINDDLDITVPRKKNKHDIDLLPENSRKTLKLLKSLSNDSIQIYLLDPYMFVHVVIRHGSGKVFQC